MIDKNIKKGDIFIYKGNEYIFSHQCLDWLHIHDITLKVFDPHLCETKQQFFDNLKGLE